MHILEAILALAGLLALIFGGYVASAVGDAEEDVSGGPAFIGCAAVLIGLALIGLAIALRETF